MNNNKVEGSNRDKTMKKQKLKEKFTPFDDDGAKVHCSLANSVLVESIYKFYARLQNVRFGNFKICITTFRKSA